MTDQSTGSFTHRSTGFTMHTLWARDASSPQGDASSAKVWRYPEIPTQNTDRAEFTVEWNQDRNRQMSFFFPMKQQKKFSYDKEGSSSGNFKEVRTP